MAKTNEEIIRSLEARAENEHTRRNYVSKLSNLSEKLGKTIYEILRSPKTSIVQIKGLYPEDSTRKTIVTSILAGFKYGNIGLSKAQEGWRSIHEELREKELSNYKKNEPTERQKENYLSFEEIREKYKELASGDPHATKKSSLEYLLLSITLNLRPKRADYGDVMVIGPKHKVPEKGNYMFIDKATNSYLELRQFKTAKTYDSVKEDLPEELYKDVKDSMRRHPRSRLFTDRSNMPYTSSAYGTYVIRCYERLFGKSVGVTMLRHIYVREKLDFNMMTQEELDEEARLMTHSPELQRLYRWVLRDNEREKCECVEKN